MTDSLGDRIRRIADEVDDALMALVRSNQRLTDGRGGEATRAVDPPTAEPLIDPDDLAAASFIGPLAVMAYLREVLTPEALVPSVLSGPLLGEVVHQRIFGEDG